MKICGDMSMSVGTEMFEAIIAAVSAEMDTGGTLNAASSKRWLEMN